MVTSNENIPYILHTGIYSCFCIYTHTLSHDIEVKQQYVLTRYAHIIHVLFLKTRRGELLPPWQTCAGEGRDALPQAASGDPFVGSRAPAFFGGVTLIVLECFWHDPKWWVEYGGIHWEGNKFRWFWFVCKVCRISYHPEMRLEENSQLTISIWDCFFSVVPNPIAYSMGFNEEYLAPGEYCHGSNSSGMLSTSLWRLGWKRMGCFGRMAPCLVCWRT